MMNDAGKYRYVDIGDEKAAIRKVAEDALRGHFKEKKQKIAIKFIKINKVSIPLLTDSPGRIWFK